MSRSVPRLLGYTRSSKPIFVPTHGAPKRHAGKELARSNFIDWTQGDHIDAAILLHELAESVADRKLARRYARWGGVHWDIGGRWSPDQIVFRGTRVH